MKKHAMSILAVAACVLLPALAADQPAVARSAWRSETLTGKITNVVPDRKLLVVQGPDGVPFDMVVTWKTRIQSGDHSLTIKDLSNHQNQSVSIKYFPERRGDVAETIRIK